MWDAFVHENSSRISDKSNGDIACDSYHKYKEDVALMKEVGVSFYRFSISWPRIMPLGTPDKVNKAGVKYYMNLLKELRSNGIEARVTLYHWDLPQTFAQQGGWLNSTIKQWFADYARFCFKQFGKYVNEWYTINEPPLICHSGYGLGLEAPGIQSPGVGEYICSKNTLLAHAAAWRIYDTEFRPRQKGRINIVLETTWYEPDTGDKDKAAAERRLQFEYGLYAHPIFRGNWPQVVIDRVALRSKLEGYPQSRLPELTAEEQHFIKGNKYTFRI
nr:unnamed protein product [Callosobruchus analis]